MERRKQSTKRSAGQGQTRVAPAETWDGTDSTFRLDELEREAFRPSIVDRSSATLPYLMSCTRPLFRRRGRLVPDPRPGDSATGQTTAPRLVVVPESDEVERAAEVLMKASPWFALAARVDDEAEAADGDSRSSVAPVSMGGDGRDALVVPMLFNWSRVGAVLGGIASFAAILAGIWISASGSLSWLPSLALAGSAPSTAFASPGASRHFTANGSPEAPAIELRDPQVLGEAAVDEIVARASAACSQGGVAPESFRMQVTFDPTGQVESATVVGVGGGKTSAAECLQAMLLRARIAPFHGDAVTVVRAFRAE